MVFTGYQETEKETERREKINNTLHIAHGKDFDDHIAKVQDEWAKKEETGAEWQWIKRELNEMYDRFHKRFGSKKKSFNYFIFNSIPWD